MDGFPLLDFDDWHRTVLPARAATALGRAAARDVAGVPPLAFQLPDGRAYRLRAAGDAIAIEAGADAATVVALAPAAWSDFVHELHTAAGLLYGGRLGFARGDAAGLERWEPALRALFSERPIVDPATLELRDRDGAPLDRRARFDLDADDAVLRHFLRETAYLVVQRVFGDAELTALRAAVAARQAAARPDDGRSWWAERADGARVLCRLIYLGLDVPAIAALTEDPRLRRLAGLVDADLRPVLDRCDGQSVVLKPPDVVAGLADLPWHRDCGLGGHPVTCPKLNVGIQLDAATAATGRLLYVPGSARGSCHRRDLDRHALAVDTAPGDCTVHFGDVFHAAPAPRGAGGRRALYVTFLPARACAAIPPGQSYNDVIRARVGG